MRSRTYHIDNQPVHDWIRPRQKRRIDLMALLCQYHHPYLHRQRLRQDLPTRMYPRLPPRLPQ